MLGSSNERIELAHPRRKSLTRFNDVMMEMNSRSGYEMRPSYPCLSLHVFDYSNQNTDDSWGVQMLPGLVLRVYADPS